MTNKIKLACLQMSSLADVDSNLRFIDQQLSLAAEQAVDIVLLPENFAQMPMRASEQVIETQGKGLIQEFLSSKAKQHKLTIIGGSIAIRENANAKPHARSLVFDSSGMQIASYDKIHLFDVSVASDQSYRESDTYMPGKLVKGDKLSSNLVIAPTKFAQLGLSICYDLRFPEMYRSLTELGAEIIAVPAAFTYDTGRAHWQVLLRARAIENQVFIIAAAQVGTHANQRRTWGHSMIIDPWGEVLAELKTPLQASKNDGNDGNDGIETVTGLVIAEIELDKLQKLRSTFPVLAHRRL